VKRDHSIRVEALEDRTLLSKVHLAVNHVAAAAVPIPLVLVGTLTVNNRQATSTENADGSTTNITPVSGQLGSLGEVRGVWNESTDAFGDYQGPDTLRLRASKGEFVLIFYNQSPGPAHPNGHGTVYYEHNQTLYTGTGAYTKAYESGTIKMVSNAAKTAIVSLELNSQTT
jgi:hypothetical protein